MVRDVSPDDVAAELQQKRKILFVDCWAPWCNPCLALAPVLDELDEKYSQDEDVAFLKVNTQIHTRYAIDNNITGIPCVLIFVDGEPARIEIPTDGSDDPVVIDRLVGLRPAQHYEFVINQVLGSNQD